MRNIAKDFDAEIINQECGEDHIHLMIFFSQIIYHMVNETHKMLLF